MGARAALAWGAALSLAASSLWSLSATLTIGPPAPLHLTRNLLADCLALAAAPFGSAAGLVALTAAAYFVCFLASGLRRIRRERAEGGD